MAELKTQPTAASVEEFLNRIPEEEKRKDAFAILKLMKQITKSKPRMWGPGIIGFGDWHYVYDSGREGDWFLTGFSPRKQSITLYIMTGLSRYDTLMKKLGKYKTGKSCLYIKRLDDVDLSILKELITLSVKHLAKKRK